MSGPSFRVNPQSIGCLNVKQLLVWSRLDIWSLNGRNRIRTKNHLVSKRTLNHFAKLAKWLCCVLHLHACFYHVTYEFQSESRLYSLPECQGTPCSKQAPFLKFKWRQPDSNPQRLSSQTKTQAFSQTSQMIELCSEYLSVRCIWLCVIIKSRTSFGVNPHSIVAPLIFSYGTCFEQEVSWHSRKLQSMNSLWISYVIW